MRNRLIILFVFAIGCFGNPKSIHNAIEARNKIMDVMGARNCMINFDQSYNSSSGTINELSIEIDGLDSLNAAKKSQLSASLAAMILYQFLDSASKSEYPSIKVKITSKDSIFETSLPMEDLQNTMVLSSKVSKFFDMDKRNDFSAYQTLIDVEYINDSGLALIRQKMLQNDSSGLPGEVNINAFDKFHLTDSDKTVTVLWTEVKNGDTYNRFKFTFSDDNQKIIGLKINGDQGDYK